ncbi:hypothetical protein IFM89_006175 [Coptis chinensis]|uniref:Increased DNA methylation 1 C-terminal domain-containing protein n=1 Tax=Coptis chinensis TaxID=261450 RepID=A0A835LHV9_9MAGN|nr:hypothetical protein IFM89_006175 [Coptis chinensis]
MFVDYEAVCSFKWSIKAQDFGGMYCAVLAVNSTVVTVATLPIFEPEIAEIPLVVATSDNQGLCEREYHIGCLKVHKMADLKWLCCTDCNRIHTALQKLVAHGLEKLPDSLLKVMLKKQHEKCPDNVAGFDVSWRFLSGKMASPENKLLLSKAVTIPHPRLHEPVPRAELKPIELDSKLDGFYDHNHLTKEYALVKTNEVLVVVYHAWLGDYEETSVQRSCWWRGWRWI